MRVGSRDQGRSTTIAARRWTCALTVALSLLSAGAGAETGDAPVLRIRMAASLPELVLRRGVEGAHRRLAQPECQRLFTDFVDERGRPLQERLDSLGMTGQQFLQFVGFYEGIGHGRCASGNVLAFTQPGSLAVWVCPQIARQGSEWAELVVLHEMLHSLGLGENPPSSQAITRQVEARCGS
jgi:hypothetical protein